MPDDDKNNHDEQFLNQVTPLHDKDGNELVNIGEEEYIKRQEAVFSEDRSQNFSESQIFGTPNIGSRSQKLRNEER